MSGMLKPYIKISEALKRLRAAQDGVVAFEFVLVAPFMLLIMFATMYFGIALNNYLILTAAAQQGAQAMSMSRGTASPYSTATAAINSAAVNLTTSQIARVVTIGGSTCSADSACSSLLTAGVITSVALTYPCNLSFMGYNFGGTSCTLAVQSASVVQ
ncbi:Flp pilus assembly protein TadG [Bradyrhizobium sp. USDA 4011]